MNYPKMMLGALYVNPQPQSVLIIGLGGGTIPRVLRQVLPDTRIDVVEIDPAVVRVANRYFDFVADGRTRIIERYGARRPASCVDCPSNVTRAASWRP